MKSVVKNPSGLALEKIAKFVKISCAFVPLCLCAFVPLCLCAFVPFVVNPSPSPQFLIPNS